MKENSKSDASSVQVDGKDCVYCVNTAWCELTCQWCGQKIPVSRMFFSPAELDGFYCSIGHMKEAFKAKCNLSEAN